jgi:hypothetical protein
MDEREQQRKIRHRLAIIRHAEQVTGDVAATCRYRDHPDPARVRALGVPGKTSRAALNASVPACQV